MACLFGKEKVAHRLKACIEEHWANNDFGVLKVDLKNALNLVSCQAISLDAEHLSELFSWVSWSYGQHIVLCHFMGCLSTKSGLQQEALCGPLLLSVLINILHLKIAKVFSHLDQHMLYE